MQLKIITPQTLPLNDVNRAPLPNGSIRVYAGELGFEEGIKAGRFFAGGPCGYTIGKLNYMDFENTEAYPALLISNTNKSLLFPKGPGVIAVFIRIGKTNNPKMLSFNIQTEDSQTILLNRPSLSSPYHTEAELLSLTPGPILGSRLPKNREGKCITNQITLK